MEGKIPRRMRRFQRQESTERVKQPAKTGLAAAMAGQPESEGIGASIFEQMKGKQQVASEDEKVRVAVAEIKRFKKEHKRMPKKNEYEQIADSIYTQLKEQQEKQKAIEKENARTGREKKEKPGRGSQRKGTKQGNRKKEVDEIMAKIKGMKKAGKNAAKPKPVEKAIPKAVSLEDESIENIPELGEEDMGLKSLEQEEKAKKCPSCGKGTELIYCPECGTAYCEKCAKKVEEVAGKKKYYCPKCGKPFET